jgi:hypothetical protein
MHGRWQLRLSLYLLAALCLASGGIVLLAHFSPVISNHVARDAVRHRDINGVLLHSDGYTDAGDYVLVGQVPYDDHSRGGVYFIGDSQSLTGIMSWRLSPAERKLIHNYSLGGLGHRELRYYIQSLVEDSGLLQAGGEKVTVFLGISHHLIESTDYDACQFVCNLFKRHGFYTYDSSGGIHRVKMSSIEQFLRTQRAHANRFLRILFQSPSGVRPLAANEQRPFYEVLPDTWPETMKSEVHELTLLLDYLLERRVHVRALLRPSGTWIDAQPYASTYRKMIEPILAARGIPLIDQTDFLPDEDLGDYVHARYTGQLKLHEYDRQLALKALAEMGTEVNPQERAR